MRYLSKRNMIYLSIIMAALIILTVQLIYWQRAEPLEFSDIDSFEGRLMSEESVETSVQEEDKIKIVVVDVKGAVVNPRTYQLTSEDRVQDALDMAGGVTEDADTLQLNLARKLYDEMMIYVPKQGELMSEKLLEINEGKISINQASADQLMTLKGIGPAKAEDIIQYREANGSFKTIEELLEVSGIGPKTFEDIKDSVTIH